MNKLFSSLILGCSLVGAVSANAQSSDLLSRIQRALSAAHYHAFYAGQIIQFIDGRISSMPVPDLGQAVGRNSPSHSNDPCDTLTSSGEGPGHWVPSQQRPEEGHCEPNVDNNSNGNNGIYCPDNWQLIIMGAPLDPSGRPVGYDEYACSPLFDRYENDMLAKVGIAWYKTSSEKAENNFAQAEQAMLNGNEPLARTKFRSGCNSFNENITAVGATRLAVMVPVRGGVGNAELDFMQNSSNDVLNTICAN